VRAMTRRIRRLETRLSPQVDQQALGIAKVLYERRRNRANAEGVHFNDRPPTPLPGPYLSVAETLRRRRELRRAIPVTAEE